MSNADTKSLNISSAIDDKIIEISFLRKYDLIRKRIMTSSVLIC